MPSDTPTDLTQSPHDKMLALARAYFENRHRIAGEIHDGFVQYVVGAKMWSESLEEDTLSEAGNAALQTSLTALADALNEARKLIRQLRPGQEVITSLGEAITHAVARYSSQAHRDPVLTIEGDLTGLHVDLEAIVTGVMHDLFAGFVDANANISALEVTRDPQRLEMKFSLRDTIDPSQHFGQLMVVLAAIDGQLSYLEDANGSNLTASFPIL